MLFQTEVGGQHITTDVTPPMGGKGRAPTPPDLFVVSLGACVAAFVAHYCEQQGIETRGLTELEGQVLVRQAKLGVSCRVQVPVGRGVGSDSS